MATLKFGDKVICEGENDEWMKVRYEEQLGFLKTEYTSQTMVFQSVSETVYVSANKLRLRDGPSVDDEILLTLGKNDKLTRTGIGDGWSRVKTASGKKGYVASEYLTKTAPVVRTPASTGSSSGGGVLYSGDAGRIVELAYQALGVRYVWGAESMSGMDCTGLTYVGVPPDRHIRPPWYERLLQCRRRRFLCKHQARRCHWARRTPQRSVKRH